jgi:Spy/CpxP family protein refolding chaperone
MVPARLESPPLARAAASKEKKMHPGMMYWWKQRQMAREAGCGHHAGHGGESPRGWHGYEASHGEGEGGGFGVRRPLRFLAYKLELDEQQVNELAKILNELKTERAQAEVDQRRTIAAFADAIAGDSFDQSKAGDGATLRVQSAERLKNAVTTALSRIHAILSPDQRNRLAYLIRTGVVTL